MCVNHLNAASSMKSSYVQLVFLLLGVVGGLAEPEANTTFGPVRGVWLKTELGVEVAGFLGIPYAEPPVGDLRFEVL